MTSKSKFLKGGVLLADPSSEQCDSGARSPPRTQIHLDIYNKMQIFFHSFCLRAKMMVEQKFDCLRDKENSVQYDGDADNVLISTIDFFGNEKGILVDFVRLKRTPTLYFERSVERLTENVQKQVK
uniref:Uncharacterized protein n=1 Tax=Caenorhabditis tropicalis TaxID=1561998 RepID=A0A1I7TFN3_9PELO